MASDYDGRTPLHVAAAEDQRHVVAHLLSRGATIHPRDRFGYPAMRDAITRKSTDVVTQLRRGGGHVPASRLKVATDLCSATFQNDLETIRCWLAAGADVNCVDYTGKTALHVAAALNRKEVISLLLEHTCDVTLRDMSGRTPIDEAELQGHSEVVSLLKAHAKPQASE